MAKLSFNSNSQNTNLLRVRLVAKLVVIFICLSLLGWRLGIIFTNPTPPKNLIITIPLLGILSLIVLMELFLYRKLGLRILRYSKYFDIVFTVIFTLEWFFAVKAVIDTQRITCSGFNYSVAVSFASFSWRALLPILITQQWQFRIVPPTVAYIYFLTFTMATQKGGLVIFALSGIFQMLYVILIYFFLHKINFTMMIGNAQNEQWLQLNSFILNNIPENIAIMDSTGNANFISENFIRLMQRHNYSQDISKFLRSIKHIQRVQQENETETILDSVQEIQPLQRVSSSESRNDLPTETNFDVHTTPSLEDIIISFGNLVRNGSVKDRSFQIFSGKFKEDDDQERSFEIKISFINHEPQKYILLILRDTTQRDQLLTLEGNIKYKDQLLASVSHELRTPLNGNINLIEAALKSKDIPQKIKDTLLTPAVRSSQFLLHLINDILDMSQIKAQKLRLVFQPSSLKEALNNTIQLMELHAKKKGVTLEVNVDPQLPDVFCTDHLRLSQIVLNLMNNSIKFTHKGYIRLSAWLLKDSGYVNVSVEDSGIGMAQEDTNKLFQDFTHINCKNREKLNPTGVGLGLKIANDLTKLLGPENNNGITVTSELGKGSAFSFLIENKQTGLSSQDMRTECKEEFSPLIPSEFHTAIEICLESKMARNIPTKSLCSLGKLETPITSIPSCTCPRVLIVDDDPFNILAYEVILNSLGVKYDCLYSGRSAIDKMLNKVRYPCSTVCCPYKIVFMDEEMPEMTGREAVSEIISLQRQNLLPQMTIIGCTAHFDGEAIENFLKCGIAEYLPKPVSAAKIQRILEKYLT